MSAAPIRIRRFLAEPSGLSYNEKIFNFHSERLPLKTCAQITGCALWAPHLQSAEAWYGWARGGASVPADPEPKAPAAGVAPMLRRRLTPLGRAAEEAAGRFPQALADDGTALVFASRWGDIEAARRELLSLAAGTGVSPSVFATSVHNGISAVLSIAHRHRGFQTAVAAGPFSLEAGFASAVGLLTEYPRVLLVSYDSRSPDAFAEAGTFTHAAAFLLEPQCEDGPPEWFAARWNRGPFAALTTRALASDEAPDPRLDTLTGTADLDVVRWLLASEAPSLTRRDRHAAWVWAKSGRIPPELLAEGAPA